MQLQTYKTWYSSKVLMNFTNFSYLLFLGQMSQNEYSKIFRTLSKIKTWYSSKHFLSDILEQILPKYILENIQNNLAQKFYMKTCYSSKWLNVPCTPNISRPKCFNSFYE